MNVFMVDSCPVKAAQALCDKHVVKMVLESAQVASTVLRERGDTSPLLYKPTHKNHPCTRAVAENEDYADWFINHGIALACEYTHRFGKTHKSQRVLDYAVEHLSGSEYGLSLADVPQAMPVEHKVEGDPVRAYRSYLQWKYNNLWPKGSARWTARQQPRWSIPLPDQHPA